MLDDAFATIAEKLAAQRMWPQGSLMFAKRWRREYGTRG